MRVVLEHVLQGFCPFLGVRQTRASSIRAHLPTPPADEPGLDTVIDFIGDDDLVWNTDYPHPDAPDPNQVLPWFSVRPISEDSKRKILWDNAVRLYGSRLLESAP